MGSPGFGGPGLGTGGGVITGSSGRPPTSAMDLKTFADAHCRDIINSPREQKDDRS